MQDLENFDLLSYVNSSFDVSKKLTLDQLTQISLLQSPNTTKSLSSYDF